MTGVANKTVYILRTVDKDRRAHGGFQWPESGPVEAPDWDPEPECGNGLHGLLRGEGNGGLLNWTHEAVWQVVAVDPALVVSLSDKVKFPRGLVVYSGTREQATAIVKHRYPDAKVTGSTATAGVRGTATAGDYGTATAGDYGTATAGVRGTATAGDYGCIIIKWYDGKRYRLTVGLVGEAGIMANTPYKCDASGKLVEATK